MSRHPIATHRSFHRLLVVFALCTGLFASACGGGGEGSETTSGGEETHDELALDPGAPRGSHVTLTFTSATATAPDEDPPRQRVGIELVDETGNRMDTTIVELTGTCGPVEAAAGGFASFQCWWAGGGTKLHARAENGELVIYREELEEGTAEDPTQAVAIRRFSLAENATLSAAPVAP